MPPFWQGFDKQKPLGIIDVVEVVREISQSEPLKLINVKNLKTRFLFIPVVEELHKHITSTPKRTEMVLNIQWKFKNTYLNFQTSTLRSILTNVNRTRGYRWKSTCS